MLLKQLQPKDIERLSMASRSLYAGVPPQAHRLSGHLLIDRHILPVQAGRIGSLHAVGKGIKELTSSIFPDVVSWAAVYASYKEAVYVSYEAAVYASYEAAVYASYEAAFGSEPRPPSSLRFRGVRASHVYSFPALSKSIGCLIELHIEGCDK